MPKRKRVQREHTEDWQIIQQYTIWPEQTAYELLRPIVLLCDPATQRAKETGEPRPTLERKVDAFEGQGLVNDCSHLEVACLCGAGKATEEVGNPPTPSRLSMGPRLPLGLSHVRDVRGTALDGTDAEDTAMLSHTIVFSGKDQVEFVKEPVRDPGSGEVLLRARKTLISTGTESICLSRLFEPGSHWHRWVTYPFDWTQL